MAASTLFYSEIHGNTRIYVSKMTIIPYIENCDLKRPNHILFHFSGNDIPGKKLNSCKSVFNLVNCLSMGSFIAP